MASYGPGIDQSQQYGILNSTYTVEGSGHWCGVMARTITSHQCDPGSTPGLGSM